MTNGTAKERTLVFQGTPVSVNSLYWQRGKVRYVTEKGKVWKEYLKWEALKQWKAPPLEGLVRVHFHFVFGDKLKRDVLNFEKALSDSLNEVVWLDDSQLEMILFTRGYEKGNPHVIVKVCPM